MRFILYARASTKDKQNPEHQIAELRTEAARRGWSVVAEVTELESGRKDNRPLWRDALDRCLAGQADGIASVELSRWGRSVAHLSVVGRAMLEAGRDLVATRQAIDTSTPGGRMFFHILAAIAEFEADLIRERVLAGVAFVRDKRKARGELGADGEGRWGRRPIPAIVVQTARDLRALGQSWRSIGATLATGGFQQPPLYRNGVEVRPARPWQPGTLRSAVEKPPSKPAA